MRLSPPNITTPYTNEFLLLIKKKTEEYRERASAPYYSNIDLLTLLLQVYAKYWVYSTGQFTGVDAFGYNSAEVNGFG